MQATDATITIGFYGVPKGIRTPVAAVKGQCPRPLDDGDRLFLSQLGVVTLWWS